jgi:cytoskeletal protein CcmA (bactofilin family)
MADSPSSKPKDQNKEAPPPEVLQPKAETESPERESSGDTHSASKAKASGKRPHRTYRPSHKGTFIGLAVVAVILLINSVIIFVVVKHQAKTEQLAQGQVTIDQSALDKLGVKRSSIGDNGVELTVNPDARFNGDVKVGGNVSIAGQLILSKRFSASDASLAQLQAGKVSISDLNVNGDGTLTNLNVRQNLAVAGNSRLQGAATFDSSVNITGNLVIGGQLTVNSLHIQNLAVDRVIQLNGHFITAGLTPGVGSGSCGPATISGNDSSGTVFVGGNCSGPKTVASITFRTAYSGYPHVAVTPVCSGATPYLRSVSSSGFSIGINGSISGGCQFTYIVMQ